MLFNPGQARYQFRPNPHNDPAYNRDQQRWYDAMAREFQRIGNVNRWNRNAWPQQVNNLTVNGINYTATAR